MDQNSSKKPTVVRLELYAQQLKNVAGTFNGVSGAFSSTDDHSIHLTFVIDPFAIVTLLSNSPDEPPRVIGKTEVINKTLSPRWTTKFDLPYELGTNARVNVGVWDEVPKGTNKPMGSALFEVGEVLGSKGNTKAKKLRQGGMLFCRITPAPEETGVLKLRLVGRSLKNVEGLFAKSNPYFEISARIVAGGGLTWQPIYRSKPVISNLDPDWEMAVLELDRLTPDGDLNRPVQVEVWDWNKHGKHTPMGKFECTVATLVSAAGNTNGFTLTRSGKNFGAVLVFSAVLEGNQNRNQGRVISGMAPPAPIALPSFSKLSIRDLEQVPDSPAELPLPILPSPMLPPPIPIALPPPAPRKPTFVEYLAGGLELELSIAIDFTGSNGNPRQPGTLHYIHPDGQLNDYEKAITAVGGIIGRYDSDQMFPVLGFGAKYYGVVQHCFQVGNAPELDGLPEVLKAYHNVFLSGLTMSSPTVFTDVIDYTAAMARSRFEELLPIGKQSYKVLLILTDGAVTHMEPTKESIRNASDAPLSIVIVGIGSANFQAMRDLDDFLSKSPTHRDIVQFVEFSKHSDNRQSLTTETLEEIPDQVVAFFQSRGIAPLPPVSGSQLDLVVEEPSDDDLDLNLAFDANGEISFLDTVGTIYDDTQYTQYNAWKRK